MRAVIDTNVLRIAEGQHHEVSSACFETCVRHLRDMQKFGITVIDDDYRILGEYLRSPSLTKSNQAGGKFLKWLLQNQNNQARVEQVPLTETAEHCFIEFPDPVLELVFDPPDRKFAAVSHAHPVKPPVWQAADSKWLDWWPALLSKGVVVEFLCPEDACNFYRNTYPKKPAPVLPV